MTKKPKLMAYDTEWVFLTAGFFVRYIVREQGATVTVAGEEKVAFPRKSVEKSNQR